MVAGNDEDQRLGLLLRAVRRRAGATQVQLATVARVPRDDVIAVEAGRAGTVELVRLRRIFAAADARLKLTAWWHGALADRLLDERHATLTEKGVLLYTKGGWETAVELTFSEWGERGSVDLLTAHRATRSAAVNEVKASFGSFEEMHRVLDMKVRLAPKLIQQRFGFRPSSVSRVLIVPSDSTTRRVIERHGETMRTLYPLRGREVRAWVRSPAGAIGGIWFASEVGNSDR